MSDEITIDKVLDLAEASKTNSEAASKAVTELTEEVTKTAATVGEVKSDMERIEAGLGQKITELRQYLDAKHGKSGGDDWFNLFSKWFQGARAAQQGKNVPDELKADGLDYNMILNASGEKATVTTGTSGTSVLVPDLLMPGIFASKDIYGTLIPRCMNVTVAPSQQLDFNREATNPVAYWRKTEGTALTEAAGTWASGNVKPVLAGSYITATNELLAFPSVQFGERMVPRMVRAILKLEETAMMQGNDDALGTAADPPSDGWLTSTSGATDVGSIAADTIAGYIDFFALCVAQYAPLINPAEAVLVLSPAKLMALAAQAVHSTNLPGALTWADPVSGMPGKIMGYDYFAHPGAQISTAHYASLLNLDEVIYANSGKLSVDFNPFGSQFLNNATDIRVITHTDWAFPQASNICFGDYA